MGDRVWMFPLNKLDELVQVLLRLASPQVKVEVLPPLKVTITASSSSSDQFVASQPSPSQTLQQSSLHPVNLPKFSVKLSLQSSGLIAAKCEYNTQLVAALRSIPKADWHPKERLWLFPVASLAEAETCLSSVKELAVTVSSPQSSTSFSTSNSLDYTTALKSTTTMAFNLSITVVLH
jgi:hypothetical protein